MYAIHTTPGFIIESRPYGEAGKTFFVFTRDLGMIRAVAQGIRFEKSKLRYHTQEYSFGVFSFVRGKEVWRMVSADSDLRFKIEDVRLEKKIAARHELIARIALLLRRLLHGEEAHPQLFGQLEAFERFLESNMEIDDEPMKSLESLVVFRMLHALGYVGKDQMLAPLLSSNEITIELLDQTQASRMHMNQHINKALRESHL